MLMEVGALVLIAKNLADTIKTGVDLLGRPRKNPAETLRQYGQRIEGLAEQLRSSGLLLRMIPIWKDNYAMIDLYKKDFSLDEARDYGSRIKNMVHESIHDQFSSTFFRTQFASLKNVAEPLEDFRKALKKLEGKIENLTIGDLDVWRASWPEVKSRLEDVRREAETVHAAADAAQVMLIEELREAGKITGS